MGKTAQLSVLLDRVGDPVDLGVPPDGLVVRVDEDDLEVLVGRVLADPVRAEDAETLDTTAHTFLELRRARNYPICSARIVNTES